MSVLSKCSLNPSNRLPTKLSSGKFEIRIKKELFLRDLNPKLRPAPKPSLLPSASDKATRDSAARTPTFPI